MVSGYQCGCWFVVVNHFARSVKKDRPLCSSQISNFRMLLLSCISPTGITTIVVRGSSFLPIPLIRRGASDVSRINRDRSPLVRSIEAIWLHSSTLLVSIPFLRIPGTIDISDEPFVFGSSPSVSISRPSVSRPDFDRRWTGRWTWERGVRTVGSRAESLRLARKT